MPSQESVFVDDTRIVDSNDDTNVREDDSVDFATFLRKERQRREDEKVYIDLTNEETVKSLCITIFHIHPGGLRADKYECTIDANKPFSLLHDELTTWDTRDDLGFTFHKNKLTKDQTSKTPIELNMKDGDEIHAQGDGIYAQGTIVSREDISVNFMDEDGDVVTIQAKPATLLSHLFEQYSVQKSISLLLSQIIFHYSKQEGEPLHYSCSNTLIYCEIASGDIIYVQRKLHSTEGLDNIQIPNVSNHQPESFINQNIWINEAMGTVVDVSHTESGTVWIVEIDGNNNVDRIECMEEDIAEGMLLYYTAHDGVEKDFSNYFNNVMQKLTSDVKLFVSQLQQQQNDDDDNRVLCLLKLEQGIFRLLEFELHIEPWMSTEMGVYIMRQCLNKVIEEYLPALSRMKKEILIKSKSPKVSKPIIDEREVVYVKSREGIPERGKVIAYKEYEDIDGYGPSRTYTILFDSGEQVDIEDYQVMLGREYTLSKHIKESDRKGVKHVCDKDSSDPWAREAGWYTVNIEGIEETFVHLSHALKAYDISQAQTKGDDLQESDLNLPNDWSVYFRARASGKSKDLQMYGATLKEQLPLTACLYASYKRIKNPIMKTIWKALIYSSEPDTMLQGFNLGEIYTYTYIDYLDCNQMEYGLYVFALWHICIQNHINTQRICRLFIAAKGNLDNFLSMVPLLQKVFESTTSAEGMLNYLKANKPKEEVNEYMFIQCKEGNITCRKVVQYGKPLKEFLTRYADDRHTCIKSLRIKRNERTLFISSIGKKTPLDLGIKEDDILEITIIQSTPVETITKEQQPKQQSKGKKNTKKKKHKQSKKKRQVQIVPPEDEMEKAKKQWMFSLYRVFAEAEPTFKEIRQRLNALNLERTKPKQRSSPSKATKHVEVIDNPLGDYQLLGGKAGKTQFIIQVGEVSNLYKTTKSTSSPRGRRQDDIMIDLHGLTAEEAVHRLDNSLLSWIETAMKGTYPFVIPVKIVCGGGSQILAEVVENWISQNDNVANAPKNMY